MKTESRARARCIASTARPQDHTVASCRSSTPTHPPHKSFTLIILLCLIVIHNVTVLFSTTDIPSL